jgi:glycosyltransferase involved in cell wall biosynthesis
MNPNSRTRFPGAKKNLGVSIIIPAHNASKTIGSTLISAMLFKPRASEILVYLDGGSTNSRIMEFLENKGFINVFRGDKKQGLAYALNFLISKSKMPVIARLDSDDLALPFYIQRALKKIRGTGVDMVFSNAIFFGESLKWFPFIPQLPYGIKTKDVPKFLVLGNPFVHPTMVAYRQALLDVGGYKNTIAEDYELWIRSTLAGLKICRIWGYGVMYRVHPGQITSTENYRSQVETNLDIKSQKLGLITLTGHQLNGGNFPELTQKISLDLESSILFYRFETKARKLLERNVQHKQRSRKS